jgi:hypothetical protein
MSVHNSAKFQQSSIYCTARCLPTSVAAYLCQFAAYLRREQTSPTSAAKFHPPSGVGAAAGMTCCYQVTTAPPATLPSPLGVMVNWLGLLQTHCANPLASPPRRGRWQVSQAGRASTAAPVTHTPPHLPPIKGRGQVS